MKNKISLVTKLLIVVAAIGLVMVLRTPIWRIELNAPQYPEGLSLSIHANGLQGNVDIINGLNHYIGMKTLHNEDFFEFTILPYCIIFFAAAFLLIALLNRRKWLNLLFILFVLFGVIAIIDFWRWEYNYGHNLNPNAAIIVPGMAYQPPLIGFKQLLNFGAYSIPDIGGWLFIGAGVILMACVILEWKKARKHSNFSSAIIIFLLLATVTTLSSCTSGPEPIVVGKDQCASCKMTISDNRYGAELITKKGKIYKFDDIHCVLSYLRSAGKDVEDIYLVDFSGQHALGKAEQSLLLQGAAIHAPMGGNIIAFSNKESLQKIALQYNATEVSWSQINK